MRTTIYILFIGMLFFSCSKDDSSTSKLTPKENSLVGKWYVDNVDTGYGLLDMYCSTCYWEFFPSKDKNGALIPMPVQIGDTIMMDKYSGQEVQLNDEEYVIVRADDIIAIIQK